MKRAQFLASICVIPFVGKFFKKPTPKKYLPFGTISDNSYPMTLKMPEVPSEHIEKGALTEWRSVWGDGPHVLGYDPYFKSTQSGETWK